MSWWPVDSTDAREYAERSDATRDHRADCEDGWLPDAPDGRARPCPDCRPHLVPLPDGRIVHRSTLAQRRNP